MPVRPLTVKIELKTTRHPLAGTLWEKYQTYYDLSFGKLWDILPKCYIKPYEMG